MPIVSFAIIAALTGKPNVLAAMALWGGISASGAGLGSFIAERLHRDTFEGAVFGSLVGTLIGAVLAGALFL